MKNKIFFILPMALIGLSSLLFWSCGNDDDDYDDPRISSVTNSADPLYGKWYLAYVFDSECTWGEYWEIDSKQIKWNNRMGGENTTYSYTKSGNTIKMRCVYASNGSAGDYDESEAVYAIENGYLTVSVDDGITRVFRK